MLSLKRYGWLCVLGAEVLYLLCYVGGYLPLRTERGTSLHHALFETLPGFTWGNFNSFVLGIIYVFISAWIFAAYFVWMHNTSIIKKN